jgi:hypothetical protein
LRDEIAEKTQLSFRLRVLMFFVRDLGKIEIEQGAELSLSTWEFREIKAERLLMGKRGGENM